MEPELVLRSTTTRRYELCSRIGSPTMDLHHGTAASADEALPMAAGQKFALALVDLVLPGMSGMELGRGARRHQRHEPRKRSHVTRATWSSRTASRAKRPVAIEAAGRFEKLQRAYESLKATQEQLVASERLNALGQMAAGVAHDFNNLLAAILGEPKCSCGG